MTAETGQGNRHTPGNRGKPAEKRRVVRVGWVSAYCLLPWCLLGCSAFSQGTSTGGDPLVGGGPAIPAAGTPLAEPAPKTASTATPKSTPTTTPGTYPAITSATSTAAIASGVPRLEGGHDLRIIGPPVGAMLVGGPQTGPAPATAASALSKPVATPGAPVPLQSEPTAPAPSVGSYEQLQSALAARGITWQRLEFLGDRREWKYSCSVPNRQRPTVSRTYEARAADSLAAMQSVLDQIQREQR